MRDERPFKPSVLDKLIAHLGRVKGDGSRDTVVPTFGGGMAMWREKLFAGMHRNAAGAADFLNLPANRIVELGSKVEI